MKKVMVCGCGAQGSTICRKLDQEPNIEEVICADFNYAAAEAVCKLMTKGTPKQVDASSVDAIVAAAEGCELIVNVMPLELGINVMKAALQVKACYQDLSACENVVEGYPEYDTWFEGIRYMYTEYGKKFAENGTTAIIGTGSAPGVMCVVARKAVNELDECDTINCMVYEGTRSKRFIPFWWSPVTALCDMEEDAFAFENCEHIRTKPFSRPVKRNWPECGREVTLVEHAHDEPVYIGFNREKYFKNCKNAYFKYGGTGIEFSEGLYKAGLLHHEEEEFNGVKISPFDWVLAHVPAAPKDPEVIKEIIDEGIVEDNGAFVCEAYGQKDGKNVMVDLHLCAPGIEEAYEKAKMSGEMYLTGQGAFLYTKLFVNEMITQKGLISSDMLDDDQVEQYLAWAAELGITYNIEIKEGVVCED
jgi:saccharopine dehydrogenase-like NADP-dependent oxidoreductase